MARSPISVTWEAKWLPPPVGGRKLPHMAVGPVPAIRGARVVADGIDQYARAMSEEGRAILKDVASKIHKEATETAPEGVSGQLKKIRLESPDGATIDIKTVAPYAAYVEFGTSRGAPSVAKIIDWMKKKGYPPRAKGRDLEDAYDRSAFLIRRAMWDRGLPPQPFFFRAFEKYRGEFIDRMTRLISG